MKFTNYRYILLMLLLAGIFPPLVGQENERVDSLNSPLHSLPDVIYKERGFNITALAAQFVPLGKVVSIPGPVAFQSQRIRNRRMLRFGLGVFYDTDLEHTSINLRLGFGREIPFHDNWTYYQGTDVWMFAGNSNVPVIPIFDDPVPGIGIAPFIGIKYHFSPHFNLSTETHVFIGVSGEIPLVIQVIPPVSLILSARLPKKLLPSPWRRSKSN